MAEEISRRFWTEYTDEAERYGDAGLAWCIHDNQWLLGWAALLAARDYPAGRLARDLEIAAEVVGEEGDGRRRLARKLREGARVVERIWPLARRPS